MKRLLTLLTAFAALGCSSTWAQENVEETVDTLHLGNVSTEECVTQVPLTECQRVDTCENAQFAIVTKDGKMGIYDLKSHTNVTPISFDKAEYYECEVTEWGTPVVHFLATKGIGLGRISVSANDDNVVQLWSDNPQFVASLTYCTTIDKAITKHCQELLAKGMKELHGMNGQIAVIDAQTGMLKAWVAMKEDNGKIFDNKLLRKACSSMTSLPMLALRCMRQAGLTLRDSIDTENGAYPVNGSLTIRDHNWRTGGYGRLSLHDAFVKHSNVAIFRLIEKACGKEKATALWKQFSLDTRATNAMELSAVANAFYTGTDVRRPALIGNSLQVQPLSEKDKALSSLSKKLFYEINQEGGIQAKYAPRKVALAGMYGLVNDEERGEREFSFVGAFPYDKPRYSMAVFIQTKQDDHPYSNADLALPVVKPLVEWLDKHAH